MRRIVSFGLGVIAAFAAAGCGAGEGGPPVDDSTLPGPGEPVSFSQHIQPIFNASCTECHAHGALTDLDNVRLYLTPGDALDSLVNQPSAQDHSLTRVVPNDSANSLLYLKVSSDRPPVGLRMPFFEEPISQKQINVIKAWIDQGALDN